MATQNGKMQSKMELTQMQEFEVFRILSPDETLPSDYRQITYHIVFDVKFDLRYKAVWLQMAIGPTSSRKIFIRELSAWKRSGQAFALGELNGLQYCAGDVENAFLNGSAKEKIYIIAGPKFSPELEGKILIVVKSLYGLRTSSASFHEHLTDNL